MNDLQVISGYIQIGQSEKALIYTKKVASSMEVFNPLAKLSLPLLQSYILSYITLLNSTREYFCLSIDGDMSSWQEDELPLTMLVKELFDPLSASIIARDLEIQMKVCEHSGIEIRFLCYCNELMDELIETVNVLNNTYQERIEIRLVEKSGSCLFINITRGVKLLATK
jgi:hypothetical protein